MLRWRGADRAPTGWGRSIVTIGMYDGVHIGHQALLAEVVERARAADLPSLVVTFDPHPREVLRPGTHPPILTTMRRKAELIEAAGIDALCVIPFTQAFSRIEPDEFVHDTLVGSLHAASVIVGSNFTFGARAAGTVATLRTLGERFGFAAEELHLVAEGGHTVSSTYVRSCVAAGEMLEATAALGRPHRIEGLVVRGDMRGHSIGFPTANLRPPAYSAIPADGVYAGWLHRRGEPHRAAVSVGTNPTFSGEERRVEAYVLDFEGDLYGEQVQLDVIERIRGQVRYTSAEELVPAIDDDVRRTRALLA